MIETIKHSVMALLQPHSGFSIAHFLTRETLRFNSITNTQFIIIIINYYFEHVGI